ncbi:MAG: hypothetical protein KF841_04885 [Phycisphaerae bacterium]|nr:hypothetical protein [Phycisphaerae bacterium]
MDGPNAQNPEVMAIAADELEAILDQATATQSQFDALSAEFSLTFHENLERFSMESIQSVPHLAYNNGHMTGTMRWWRDGQRERLDAAFDIPEELMRHEYEDFVIVKDAERQIDFLCRTRQAAILRPGLLRSKSPADWLIPGSKKGLGTFRGDDRFQIRGFWDGNDGDCLIRIAADGISVINMTLSAAFDFSITNWRSGDNRASGSIYYGRDAAGRVVPRLAEIELRDNNGSLIRRSELRTESFVYGVPSPEAMQFQFPPNSLVLDNRTELHGGRQIAFEADSAGQLHEVPAYAMSQPSTPPPGRQKPGMAATYIGVFIVAVVLGFRACSVWVAQRGRRR